MHTIEGRRRTPITSIRPLCVYPGSSDQHTAWHPTCAIFSCAGAAHQAFDWVKFDVVRDFFQTIALFFASIASAAIIQVSSGSSIQAVGRLSSVGILQFGV